MDSCVKTHGSAPRQTTLSTLASLYGASEASIRQQLREQGCGREIENESKIDTLSLFRRLSHYQANVFDLSGDESWVIATPAIVSVITDLPRELMSEQGYLARLSPTVLLDGQITWRHQEVRVALCGGRVWATQWAFCGELGLSQSQRSWLIVNGGVPMAFLGGNAIPGWPWVFFENSRCLRFIENFKAEGIPDLAPGILIDLAEIESQYGISQKEVFALILRDQMIGPLQDSSGLAGWPRDYVQDIASRAEIWRAGGNLVYRETHFGKFELAWNLPFLDSPEKAWAEYFSRGEQAETAVT